MGASDSVSKFVLVIINVVFMLFGVTSLALGVVFKVGWDKVRDAFHDHSDDQVDFNLQAAGDVLSYGAITLGAFILVLSLLGCIGACCRVKCLLVLYAIVVGLLLAAQVAIIAVSVDQGSHQREKAAEGLKRSMKNYYENSTNDESKAFTVLFDTLKCCGVDNFTKDFTTDMAGVPFYAAPARDSNLYPLVIPVTCCKGVDSGTKLDPQAFTDHRECLLSPTEENARTEGCLDVLEDEISKHKGILIGVGAAILLVEVLVILLSIIMVCRSDDKFV